MKKTSIYLPKRLLSTWNRKHRALLSRLPALIRSARRFTPTRSRLRQHQQCPEGGAIISVYWPLSTYNRLHSFATATRISVSLLISHLLEKLQKRTASEQGVLNYDFQVIGWTDGLMAFREELRFFTIPPPLTP